jgi:DNA polymerase III sliding clamp (beta) subunit (PCNA family)
MSTAIAEPTETKSIPSGRVAASALLRAVRAVKPVAKPTRKRGASLIPARIHLHWTEDTLTVSATDGAIWASYRIESAPMTAAGSCALPASLLATVAHTTGTITIRPVGDDQVSFTSASGTITLRVAPGDDRLRVPEFYDDAPTWPVDPAHIRALLPAVSDDLSRPILNCVAFQDGAMVATDSYRLHFIDTGVPAYPTGLCAHGTGLPVPKDGLRWVAKESGPVTLSATSNGRHVQLTGGAQTWIVATEQGSTGFPDWRRLIKQSASPNHLVVDRSELLAAVRHCNRIKADPVAYPLKLDLTARSVRAYRTIPDVVTMESTVVARWDGPDTTTAFTGAYLADCLAVGLGDTATIGINAKNPRQMSLITDDSPCRRILMPVVG